MAKPASGMYKTKARNLTDAQLKRAKGAGAAAKRTVSVSATSRATTGANKGYTLGAGGKRLTGTVVMANGDRAVYKGGKRVTNVPKASAPKKGGGGGGNEKTKTKTTNLTAAQKDAMKIFSGVNPKPNTVVKKSPPKTFAGSSVPKKSKIQTKKTGLNAPAKDVIMQILKGQLR